MGSFFNKQSSGYFAKFIKSDARLNDMLDVIATFNGSAMAEHRMTLSPKNEYMYKENEEFVAIAEGKELPIYVFTYNIEMTQFIYTDLMV